ncbi:MAG: response regulator [Methylotenera sp.]|nr:response regulator [Methylotenera sp.]
MRILLIDDTQLNITLLQHLIKKIPEYESIAFTNPVEALDWCRDNEPDLVVVDYMMPEMDGIQFTQQFRGFVNYQDIPVLMVTANSETSVRHKALVSGVTDFLNKPLDNSEFVARARNMLALRQSQKKLMDHAAWLADEVSKATAIIKAQERETIFCLAKAAEYRDPETGAHIQRMAHYSKHIARVLGLSVQQQELLLEAAPMHDIGKVGIADAILLKPGKLTPEEFTLMKQHAVIGYRLLNESSSPLLKLAAEIAHTHHEKYDGSGYPRGLANEEIPLFGRIVAVADVFDALTSERPYKRAWSIEDACQLLRDGIGQHFDPTCVEAFFSEFDEVIKIKNTFLDDENDH